MILIGQYDSPFVRRVAIAARLYDMTYEHRPWSVFRDADALAAINPLRRVPTLILDDGEVLVESGAMLDAFDDMVGPDRALAPRSGPLRRRHLKTCGLATGLADKAVSLIYELLLHEARSQVWIDRCHAQIGDVLDALEAERAIATSTWWFGEALSHADIIVACAVRFTREAHPDLFAADRWPTLTAQIDRCEALDAFSGVVQAFTVTLPKAQ